MMTGQFVHEQDVLIALDQVEGFPFERFAQQMFCGLLGPDFVPTGGQNDGGADGLIERGLFEESSGTFLQASVERDHRGKIRRTVKRLRKVGRDPVVLIHVTPHVIPMLDKEEMVLSSELRTTVKIRERSYLVGHVNSNPQTRAAFEMHLRPILGFLDAPGSAPLLAKSEYVKTPDVYVFLRQELERRTPDTPMNDAVLDSLILWALEGTNPDEAKFMKVEEVWEKVQSEVPPVAELYHSDGLHNRLQKMCAKDYPAGRAVNWHKDLNSYCLPYDTRVHIENENREDAALQIRVRDGLRVRVEEQCRDVLDPRHAGLAVDVCIDAIKRTFEREGLLFAYFLSRKPDPGTKLTVEDSVQNVLDDRKAKVEDRVVIGDAVIGALRGAFYSSSVDERLYLSKLSRTYALLFMLQSEPRVVEYFQELSANFYLYVGTDILIRALTERYLRPEDQMTRNMLRIVAEAGATLVLAEPVLEEVTNHVRGTDRDFQSLFAEAEPYLKPELTRQADKILIRAYFYARLEPARHDGRPTSWRGFLDQFCDYEILHKPAATAEFKAYLQGQFGLEFVSYDELAELVDKDEVEQLGAAFEAVKKSANLARHDALVTLAVYGRRAKERESAVGSEFGFRTWWLTGETSILEHTQKLVDRQEGKRFIMRPEFLLNLIALSPRTADARRTFESVFPSLQGIKLANRVKPATYRKLMKQVGEAVDMETGRRQARIRGLIDQLAADRTKEYTRSLGS